MMMFQDLVNVGERELEICEERYHNATAEARRCVDEYAMRPPTDHFGHNLAARAAELSELAGKVATAKAFLMTLRAAAEHELDQGGQQ